MEVTVYTVFVAALITAIATGLGAVPFLFVPRMSRTGLGISNAAAGGLMLAASAMLLFEGWSIEVGGVVGGALAGVAFIYMSGRWLNGHDDFSIGDLKGADALKALMIVGVMTVHSFTEGVGVGVSYGGGQHLGAFITAAIAVHNIPEGLAISLVLIPRGTTVAVAALWAIFSSLPQPVMAVPAYLFVEAFRPFLPVGLGFAAGAMLWMTFTDLVPDALEDASRRVVAATFVVSAGLMILFQIVLKGA